MSGEIQQLLTAPRAGELMGDVGGHLNTADGTFRFWSPRPGVFANRARCNAYPSTDLLVDSGSIRLFHPYDPAERNMSEMPTPNAFPGEEGDYTIGDYIDRKSTLPYGWTVYIGGVPYFYELGEAPANIPWRPSLQCERLGFAANCYRDDAGGIIAPYGIDWLKPTGGAIQHNGGRHTPPRRPYSGAGGTQFPSGGLLADYSDWLWSPSVDDMKNIGLVQDLQFATENTADGWESGSPTYRAGDTVMKGVYRGVDFGPFDPRLLFSICTRKQWTGSGYDYTIFPMYWQAGAAAPDGFPDVLDSHLWRKFWFDPADGLGSDPANAGRKAALESRIPPGVAFDLRLHVVQWYVRPARNAMDVNSGLPELALAANSPAGHFKAIYFTTDIQVDIRIVAPCRAKESLT